MGSSCPVSTQSALPTSNRPRRTTRWPHARTLTSPSVDRTSYRQIIILYEFLVIMCINGAWEDRDIALPGVIMVSSQTNLNLSLYSISRTYHFKVQQNLQLCEAGCLNLKKNNFSSFVIHKTLNSTEWSKWVSKILPQKSICRTLKRNVKFTIPNSVIFHESDIIQTV